jgi:hypothetical protein
MVRRLINLVFAFVFGHQAGARSMRTAVTDDDVLDARLDEDEIDASGL